ncbi:MAG: flavin reductase [Acetobacteraceae bacterium]|nr:flavin reductase [Acetobacteraceae bacterium]
MSDNQTNSGAVTAEFKRAMRRLASTVTIISTADVNGNRYGMTATAVSSVSMDPPSLLICVNQNASIHAPLLERGAFCINVLTTEHEELVNAFSGRLSGSERFTVGEWRDDASGIPYLDGAQCNLVCDIDTVMPFGTHSIIIGLVTGVRVAEGITPLIYADGKLAASQSLTTGHVRIAANLSSISEFLPQDLKSFRAKNPLIRIHLEEKVSTAVVSAVAENAADVGLITEGPKTGELKVFPYRRDRLVLVVPSAHPLAARDIVSFTETLAFDYVGLHTGSQINLQVQKVASELDQPFKCRMQVTSYDALCFMIEAGLGIGMVPEKIAQTYAKALDVRVVKLDEDWVERTLAIVVRSYEALPVAAKRLVDHLRRLSA